MRYGSLLALPVTFGSSLQFEGWKNYINFVVDMVISNLGASYSEKTKILTYGSEFYLVFGMAMSVMDY